MGSLIPEISDAQETEKTRLNGVLWTSLAGHFSPTPKDHIFFINNYRWRNDDFGMTPHFPGNKLFRFQHELGIIHNLNDHWRFGGSAKFVRENSLGNQGFFKAIIAHKGKLGSLDFTKSVLPEYLVRPYQAPNLVINDLGRVSFMVNLHKDWRLPKHEVFLEVSERAFLIYDMEDFQGSIYELRFIDKTRLRIDAGIYLGNKKHPHQWRLTFYSMRETNYFYNQLDDANSNQIIPTLGAEVHYQISVHE